VKADEGKEKDNSEPVTSLDRHPVQKKVLKSKRGGKNEEKSK